MLRIQTANIMHTRAETIYYPILSRAARVETVLRINVTEL